MKRVLFLNPGHLARGGVENGIVTLCRSLPRSDWRVSVGITQGKRFHDPQTFRDEYPDIETVAVESLSGTREGRIRAIQKCVRQLSPHIIIAPRIPDAYPAVALLKQQGDGVRLGANIRGCVPELIADVQLFEGYIDMAVGASRLLQQTIRESTSIPSDRVFAISSGVALPRRDMSRKSSTGPLEIGYIGRLDHHDKRVLDVANLVEQLMHSNVPVVIHIVGDGSAYYSSCEELRTRLHTLKSEIDIVWHGWLSKAHLQKSILPRLDCCLLFSPIEGAPTALREAMAYGVVPVSSEFLGCHAERLYRHNENCMLFPVGDTTTAVRHIRQLHKDRELLAEMSAAAMISVRDGESIQASTEKWCAAIEHVIKQPIRMGGSLPASALRSPGRLNRLSPAMAETARRILGSRAPNDTPGDEWPAVLGVADPECVNKLNCSLHDIESSYRQQCREMQQAQCIE